MRPPGTWEVQWHPASGGAPRRWLLTPAARYRLTLGGGAVVLVAMFLLGLLPVSARTLVARWGLAGMERENRALRREEAARRERAVALMNALDARLDRGRRLAWALSLPEAVWRPGSPPVPTRTDSDVQVLAWLARAAERVAALGEQLGSARPTPVCPLGALPTAMPVDPSLSVPVALYGWRTSPFTGQREPHFGVTVAAPRGQPVVAVGGGTVRYAGVPREQRSNEWTRFGMLVVIDHGGGVYSILGGLSTVGVKRGDAVRRGEVVGTVGQSAWSRVPAVYWEVRWPLPGGSRPIDPALVCPGLPLPDVDGRLASPAGDLPDDFARLQHILGRR